MKRLNLMFLLIGVTFLFFSCSKDNSTLAPDLSQSDQETTSLKAKKVHTHFTGESTPIVPIGTENAWYDNTDDARVTGVSIWISNPPVPIDEVTFELSGTGQVLMGAVQGDYNYVGKWETSWHGTQTLTPDGFRIVAHAVGNGTEGDVVGLTARWKYTMDYVGGFPFDPTHPSFKYIIKGKITEEL